MKNFIINTDKLTQMQLGRVQKSLRQRFNYEGEIMTLQELIEFRNPVKKHIYTRTYETDECFNGPRSVTKTIQKYILDCQDNFGFDVPKIIYDCIEFN